MAMQTPFFGKREPDAGNRAVNPYGPGSGQGAHATPGITGAQSVHPNLQGASAQPAASVLPAQQQPSSGVSPAVSAEEGGSKLTVGPNIKLKGVEITDCDTLVVEGTVEATMDSRVIQIAEHGAFKGSAEIDLAEIHGEFDGNLTVRKKLVIHSTGRVTGKIRYSTLQIEEGGQLSGDIQFGAPAATAKGLVLQRPLQAVPAV
jgi:cytoskeletal protein CcmA (bactofilin family)